MLTLISSHKWGLVADSATFYDQDLSALRRRFEKQGVTEWIEEPCILKAGQASFHHALCFHGSGPNQSYKPRRSVAIHLMPDGTGYRPGVQYHTNVRLLGPRPVAGQKFNNHYFPLLEDTRYEMELRSA
jgi:ectoine hydroxylase-related dioxygenase (phytanoyl-CoA dioxygenase family)